MRKVYSLLLTVVVLAGCTEDPFEPGGDREWITIEVIDQDQKPVQGANVICRIDWNAFHEVTDADGRVTVYVNPNRSFSIEKEGYFPVEFREIRSWTYQIKATPWQATEVGKVLGNLIEMDERFIKTSSFGGVYRLYEYGQNSIFLRQEVKHGIDARHYLRVADTLWLLSSRNTLHAFRLDNGYLENEIHRYPAFSWSSPFTVWDSLIANVDDDDVVIYSVESDSVVVEHSRIPADRVYFLQQRDSYLLLSDRIRYLKVYDVSAPQSPELVYEIGEDFYDGIYVSGDLAFVQYHSYPLLREPSSGFVLDLSNLESPQLVHGFKSTHSLAAVSDEVSAITHWIGGAIVNGYARMSPDHEFSILYTSSETEGLITASFSNYVIAGGTLRRLRPRD